jgi:hypothetical protein
LTQRLSSRCLRRCWAGVQADAPVADSLRIGRSVGIRWANGGLISERATRDRPEPSAIGGSYPTVMSGESDRRVPVQFRDRCHPLACWIRMSWDYIHLSPGKASVVTPRGPVAVPHRRRLSLHGTWVTPWPPPVSVAAFCLHRPLSPTSTQDPSRGSPPCKSKTKRLGPDRPMARPRRPLWSPLGSAERCAFPDCTLT